MPRHAVARGASAPAGRGVGPPVRGWPAPRKTAAAAGAGWLSAGHRRPCAAIAGPLCRLSTRQPAGRQADTHIAPQRGGCTEVLRAAQRALHVGQGLDVALELAGWTEQQQRLAGIAQAFDADPRRMLAPRPLVGGVIQARAQRRVPTLEAAAERAIQRPGRALGHGGGDLRAAFPEQAQHGLEAFGLQVGVHLVVRDLGAGASPRGRGLRIDIRIGIAELRQHFHREDVPIARPRQRAWPRPLPCAARDAWGARLAAVAAGRTARTAGARRSADHG